MSASEYAAMASAAYGPLNGEDPLKKMIKFGAGKIDESTFSILESTNNYTVFRKTSTNEVVVAIKGTSTAGDWASNVLIFMGSLGSDPRMVTLINLVRKYKRLGVDVSVTGHSLGGALAADLARNEHVLGVTFNMGSGLAESTQMNQASSSVRGEKHENVIHFTTGVDPLSAGVSVNPVGASQRYYLPPSLLNPHAMDNFIGLDDSLYEQELNTRAQNARIYREQHPNEKINEYSLKERADRLEDDLKKIVNMIDNIYTVAKRGGDLWRNRAQIPENFMAKLNQIRTGVSNALSKLRNLGRVAQEGSLEEIAASAQEFGIELRELTGNVRLDSILQDLGRVGQEGDPFVGEAAGLADEIAALEAEQLPGALGAAEGELAAAELEAGVIEELGSSMTLAAGLEMANGVVGVLLFLWTSISTIINWDKKRQKQTELVQKIDNTNDDFDHLLEQKTRALSLYIPSKIQGVSGLVGGAGSSINQQALYEFSGQIPPINGIQWRNRDLMGSVVFKYLDWRRDNPEVYYDGGGSLNELHIIQSLYMTHISPGVPLFAPDNGVIAFDVWRQNMKKRDLYAFARSLSSSPGDRDLSSKVVPKFSNGWTPGTYFDLYNRVMEFNLKTNNAAFSAQFETFMKQHKRHRISGLSVENQLMWANRVLGELDPWIKEYVGQILSLLTWVSNLPISPPDILRDLVTAMEKLKTTVISLVSQYSLHTTEDTAADGLVRFIRTHSFTILKRGIESGMWRGSSTLKWMAANGADLSYYQTYFDLGTVALLGSKPQTVDEQNTVKFLTQHEIEDDFIDMEYFRAHGGKTQGDFESTDEFDARFRQWQEAHARDRIVRKFTPKIDLDHGYHPADPDRFGPSRSDRDNSAGPDNAPIIPKKRMKRDRNGVLWACPMSESS